MSLSLAAQTNARVHVASSDIESTVAILEAMGLEVGEAAIDAGGIEMIVSPTELGMLNAGGFLPQIVEQGGPLGAGIGTDGVPPTGYPNLTAIYAAMNAAAAAHPGLCQVVDLTATLGTPATFEGRHVFVLKISDNVLVDEDEPNALIVSAHHCREISTPTIALFAMDQFLNGYGVDPQITALVDGNEIWIAPVWNPDGYEYVFTTDNLWRKNRRVFANGTGVDLNRNYPFGWSSSCAGSTSVGSETYKGPSSGSEAETQTMLAFSAWRRFARVIDFHSYGREALWGYRCWSHPFSSWLQGEGIALSFTAGYNGDERVPSAHGENYQWQRSVGVHAFLLETHTSFQPSYVSAQNEAVQVFGSILWLLGRQAALAGHVVDACTGEGLDAAIAVSPLAYTHGEQHLAGGSHGRYEIFVPSGTYTFTASKTGYLPVSQTLAVTDTATTAAAFSLPPIISAAAPTQVSIGATANMSFDAPGEPLAPYVAALGLSGLATFPYPIGNCFFPLELDAVVLYSAQNLPPFFGFAGNLDALGHAAGGIVLPNEPGLAGRTCHIAFVTLDVSTFALRHASPAAVMNIVP